MQSLDHGDGSGVRRREASLPAIGEEAAESFTGAAPMNADNPVALINPGDLSPQAIGGLFRKAHTTHVESVHFLIQCGQRLHERRESLPHGEWLPWIDANCETLGFG